MLPKVLSGQQTACAPPAGSAAAAAAVVKKVHAIPGPVGPDPKRAKPMEIDGSLIIVPRPVSVAAAADLDTKSDSKSQRSSPPSPSPGGGGENAGVGFDPKGPSLQRPTLSNADAINALSLFRAATGLSIGPHSHTPDVGWRKYTIGWSNTAAPIAVATASSSVPAQLIGLAQGASSVINTRLGNAIRCGMFRFHIHIVGLVTNVATLTPLVSQGAVPRHRIILYVDRLPSLGAQTLGEEAISPPLTISTLLWSPSAIGTGIPWLQNVSAHKMNPNSRGFRNVMHVDDIIGDGELIACGDGKGVSSTPVGGASHFRSWDFRRSYDIDLKGLQQFYDGPAPTDDALNTLKVFVVREWTVQETTGRDSVTSNYDFAFQLEYKDAESGAADG